MLRLYIVAISFTINTLSEENNNEKMAQLGDSSIVEARSQGYNTGIGIRTRAAVLLLFMVPTSAQTCYSNLTCGECISNTDCGWCPGVNLLSPSCIEASPFSRCADGYAMRVCVFPSAVSVAWSRMSPLGVGALGAIAIFALSIVTFTSIENYCGQVKYDFTESSIRPTLASVRVLFIASAALWMGLSCVLAAPALPWLGNTDVRGSVAWMADAFTMQQCAYDYDPAMCTSFSIVQIPQMARMDTVSSDYDTAVMYGNRAAAMGGLVYIFAVTLVLPAALMASIAVYRVSKLLRYNVPPFSSGCSMANLAVAQTLGWIGFGCISVIWFVAIETCKYLSTTYAGVNLFSSRMPIEYAGMPGMVIMGIGFGLMFIGMSLTAYSAHLLGHIKGVGCKSACCKLRVSITFSEDDTTAIEVRHQPARQTGSERTHLLHGDPANVPSV